MFIVKHICFRNYNEIWILFLQSVPTAGWFACCVLTYLRGLLEYKNNKSLSCLSHFSAAVHILFVTEDTLRPVWFSTPAFRRLTSFLHDTVPAVKPCASAEAAVLERQVLTLLRSLLQPSGRTLHRWQLGQFGGFCFFPSKNTGVWVSSCSSSAMLPVNMCPSSVVLLSHSGAFIVQCADALVFWQLVLV